MTVGVSLSLFLSPMAKQLNSLSSLIYLNYDRQPKKKRYQTQTHPFFSASSPNVKEIPHEHKRNNKIWRKTDPPPPPRARRRLIAVPTAGNERWRSKWRSEHFLSLRELQLADLAEDEEEDAEVLVSLSIQKHASFGFSIDGRITMSLNRKCSCCSSKYCREIDTSFDVWVLPSSRSNHELLNEAGETDPSVIYVTPGSEADLAPLVKDTIRLAISEMETACSESCMKSYSIWQYSSTEDHGQGNKKILDQRWSRLLEMKKSMM